MTAKDLKLKHELLDDASKIDIDKAYIGIINEHDIHSHSIILNTHSKVEENIIQTIMSSSQHTRISSSTLIVKLPRTHSWGVRTYDANGCNKHNAQKFVKVH